MKCLSFKFHLTWRFRSFLLLALLGSAGYLSAQERFRNEAWQFDRRSSVRNLNSGSAASRYKAALGVFFRSVNRNGDDIEKAIDTMHEVYDEARARAQGDDYGRSELAIFEGMLGMFNLGLAETLLNERERETAAHAGLRYLDTLLREYPDNIDVLFIYVRSTWFVPTTFEDLTKDIKYAGERYLSRSDLRPSTDLALVQRNAVLIALANIAIEEGDKDTARDYFQQVNRRSLRILDSYGCGRLRDVYYDIEQALSGRSGVRVRTSW